MDKLKIIFIFLLVLLYSYAVSVINSVSFFPVLIAVALLFFIVFLNVKKFKERKYLVIYIILFLIQLLLIVYNSVHRDLPFTNVDWYNYDMFAKDALSKSSNFLQIFDNAIDLFTAIVAVMYKLFGSNITLIYFYILPLSHLSFYYMNKCVYKLTGSYKYSTIASIILLIYPINFIFSMSVLREIPIQCLVLISFSSFLNFFDNKNIFEFIKTLIFSIFAAMMHSGMIGIVIVYLYVFIQKMFSKKVKMFSLPVLLLTLCCIVMFSFLPLFNKATSRFNNISSADKLVEVMRDQNEYLDANTKYIQDIPDSFVQLILTIPYRILMFVISPLPWQVYSFSTILSLVLDGFLRYYIVYMVYKSFKSRKKRDKKYNHIVITILMCILLCDLIFSLGVNNYGQAMRHRTKLLPLEIILIIYYKSGEENEKS